MGAYGNIAFLLIEGGVDATVLPMFLQTGEEDPAHAVVLQGSGLETYFGREVISPFAQGLADECEDLLLGGVVVLVAHFRADDMGELMVVDGESLRLLGRFYDWWTSRTDEHQRKIERYCKSFL